MEKLVTVRLAFVVVSVMALVIPTAADASGEEAPLDQHCATYLEPVGTGDSAGADATTEVDMGCYETYAQAVAVGTGGAVLLPESATPASVTRAKIRAAKRRQPATEDGEETAVLIGTEFVEKDYDGSSKSYFASAGCANHTWEDANVGPNWNDDFESGKGFANCDHNRKFEHQDFGGDVVLCTPNCAGYGAAMNNDVTSLRWKD